MPASGKAIVGRVFYGMEVGTWEGHEIPPSLSLALISQLFSLNFFDELIPLIFFNISWEVTLIYPEYLIVLFPAFYNFKHSFL